MKKYISAGLLTVSLCALAATEVVVTTGAQTPLSSGTAGAYTVTGVAGAKVGDKFMADTSGSFVKVVFTVTAGNNVINYIQNDASMFSVASTSTKGNQVFGGNSTVGAVKLLNGCAADPCVVGDATAGLTKAVAMSS